MSVSIRNAKFAYLAWSWGSTFLFALIFTVLGTYYVNIGGLNPFQLVLVGTVLETTIFIFEVPTGVVADTYSRRASVIIGVLLIGTAYAFLGVSHILGALLAPFAAILIAEIIRGIGETFTSGAASAWLADEVGEDAFGHVVLRGSQIGPAFSIVGIGASMFLGSIDLRLPIFLGGALFVALGVFLITAMPETGFRPKPRENRGALQHMGRILGDGLKLVRARPVLLTILIAGVVYGAFTEGFDRLNEAHFLRNIGFPEPGNLQPVAWFGLMSITLSLLHMVVTGFVRRRINTDRPVDVARVLFALSAALSAGVIAFGLAGNFAVAISAFFAINLMRGLRGPLTDIWLNYNVDSEVRATVLSMSSQADALGQLAVGPMMGAVGALLGIPAAMVVAGLVMLPSLLLYGRALRREVAEAAEAATGVLATEG